jgi:hypothetical protein
MNRVCLLFVAATVALACVHAQEPSEAEERPAVRPATPPSAPAPQPARPATAAKSSDHGPAAATTGKPASSSATAQAAPSAGSKPASAPKAAAAAAPAGKAEVGGPAEYFPLAVGNEWIYVDQSPALPESRRGVLRTVRILERTADGFYRDNERGNLRVEGACVRDRDRRLLCLPFTAGATWTSVVSPTVIERYEIANPSETVETPAGKFERCVRVRAHNRVKASIDQVLEITYAPRVGPVLIETYIVVDGRVTPQVKAMLQSYKLSGGA